MKQATAEAIELSNLYVPSNVIAKAAGDAIHAATGVSGLRNQSTSSRLRRNKSKCIKLAKVPTSLLGNQSITYAPRACVMETQGHLGNLFDCSDQVDWNWADDRAVKLSSWHDQQPQRSVSS